MTALVHERKPFLFGKDYVGPDHRTGEREDCEQPLIVVPNTLRAKALGEWDPKLMARNITETRARVDGHSLDQAAEDISALIELIAKSGAGQCDWRRNVSQSSCFHRRPPCYA